MSLWRFGVVCGLVAGLAACAVAPSAGPARAPVPADTDAVTDVLESVEAPAPALEPVRMAGVAWWPVHLPGKKPTRYAAAAKDGRQAVLAHADRSASLLRHRLDRRAAEVGEVSFSWWVPQVLSGGDVRHAASGDAVARVMFAFGGDVAKLPLRTRMQFELMQALTGEPPPYATLMYVYDGSAPVGTVVVNPRSDRIRKIVLDGGAEGLKRWRDHRRNLREDFIRAFGEDPGPLQAVALMTDTDNTASHAETWYGPVVLH